MIAGNPFVGLRPFDRSDAQFFFGRDDQLDALTTRLGAERFVAVLGSSGAGKSSLVRAGLLPALEGGLVPGIGSAWAIAVMTPGANPIGSLAAALVRVLEPQASTRDKQSPFLEAVLRRGALGLVEAVRESPLGSRPLFLLVDQFEEIFRFKRMAQAAGDLDHASAFVKLLLEAVRQETPAVYVMLTMRSEFLGNTSEFHDLPEAINDGLFLIPRLTRDQLTEAISGPVAVAGGRIAPSLVQRLLNDVGDDADQLPVLQHALLRTWEEWRKKGNEPGLTIEHYEAIKGLSGALSEHADEAFLELDDKQQKIAEMIFKALTERGSDGREVRRPTSLRELAAVAGVSVEEVITVVDRFRCEERSFLMPSGTAPIGPDTVVDISHESLMRKWNRLRDWVAEEAEDRRTFLRLSDSAAQHGAGQEPLLRDPRLTFCAQWRTRFAPTDAWARRYAPNLTQALTYLDTSLAARRSEDRRRRLLGGVIALALITIVASVIWELHSRQDRQRDHDLQEAQVAQAKAEVALATAQSELDRTRAARSEKGLEDAQKSEEAQRMRDEREAQRLAISFATRVAQIDPGLSEEEALIGLQALIIARRSNNQEAVSDATKALTNAVRLLPDVRLDESLRDPVRAIAASKDALVVRQGFSGQDSLRLWRSTALRPLVVGSPPSVDATSSWASTGTRSVWLSGRTLHVWDVDSGEPASLELPASIPSPSPQTRLVLSPDGQCLLLGGASGVDLWNLTTQTTKHLESTTVGPTIFSGDSQTVATTAPGAKAAIHLWTPNGDPLADIPLDSPAQRLAIDDAGTWLAASYGTQVAVWCIARDANGGAKVSERGSVPQRNTTTTDFAFSSKGLFASSGEDGAAAIFRVPAPDTSKAPRLAPQSTISHARGAILRVLFSPDGGYLATGGADGTARLWSSPDARSVRLSEQFRVSHEGPVIAIAFLADGTLASVDSRGLVRASKIPGDDESPKTADSLISMACVRVGRTLTALEWITFFHLEPYESVCRFKLDPQQVLELEIAHAQSDNAEQARRSAEMLAAMPGMSGVPALGLDRLMTAAIAEAKVENTDLSRERLAMAVRIAEAVTDPKERAQVENELCWRGAIGGLAADVLKRCDAAFKLDPKIDYLTTRAIAYAKSDHRDTAKALFNQAVGLAGNITDYHRGDENNNVCWRGAIFNFAQEVRSACDAAVRASPQNIAYLDSQGVAYALIGSRELLNTALANFRAYAKGATNRRDETIAKRVGWSKDIEQGRNPFRTNRQAVLDGLADDLANERRAIPPRFARN
jgi:WD40 repeat protein